MTGGPSDAPVVVLAGPTAVGKSAIALLLSHKLGGEIVSVDSMQVYRGMDIGTAKPTSEERGRVPHHLIDVAEASEPFNAAEFVRLAQPAIAEIHRRGRVPILCGGTGLYLAALFQGLGSGPAGDPLLRARLEQTPQVELLAELKECDLATWETIDRENSRRVVRAVEIWRLTGKPPSTQRADWNRSLAKAGWRCHGFAFSRSNSDLHRRIEQRVDWMFQNGLIAETERLLAKGLDKNPTAMQSIGYRQVAEHLRGVRSLGETIELVKIRTRQFSKRQMTWFKRQFELEWFRLEKETAPETIAGRLAQEVQSAGVH